MQIKTLFPIIFFGIFLLLPLFCFLMEEENLKMLFLMVKLKS